jgi:mannose-6-phosphate isomerase-like protein (cupin superfamily)
MKVTRLKDAKPYPVTKHFACTPLRLQGGDASPVQNFTVGLSHFLPAGGAERGAGPREKVYVVVSGEITVVMDDAETTLGPLDSIYIGPGEMRSIENRTNLPASMLVIMPVPGGQAK